MGFSHRARRSIAIGVGIVGLCAAVPAGAAAADRFVATGGSDTANDCLTEAAPCATVQRAVDQAAAGDAIHVGSGTHSVSAAVAIDKANLTITGAGAGSTTVSRAGATNHAFDLRANADGLTIEDLTIDNSTTMGTSHGGIRAAATGGSMAAPIVVDDVTLRDIEITDFRYGVDVPNTAQITGWTLDGIDVARQDIGLRLNGKTDDLAITGSTLEGNDQAISNQYSSTAQKLPGQFSDVLISNTSFDANSTKGIYLESAQDVVIEDSSFVGTGTIACRRACPDAAPTNAIDVNVKWTDYSNVTVRDSTIADTNYVGSAAFGSPSAAVAIKARNDGTSYSPVPATLDGVVLENLTITGNEEGGVDFGNAVTNATVRNSRILDNGVAGITSYTDSGTIDGEDNWWGCDAGPGDPACDALAGAVDADPRLVVSVGTNPATVAPGGATAQITADLARNSDGAAVNGPLSSLDGLTVDFATDLGSLSPTSVPVAGGTATTTFTSGAQTGTANVSAAVDGQSGGATVLVANPPADPSPSDPDPGQQTLPAQGPSGPTDDADTIRGTTSDDLLEGRAGDDDLFGDLGNDLIRGEAGNDRMNGGVGDDEVRGGDGDDTIRGGAGNDLLRGGPGDDRIEGGGGEDDIGSGGGDDVIDAQDGEADLIRCGPGDDDLDADGADTYGPNCENVS